MAASARSQTSAGLDSLRRLALRPPAIRCVPQQRLVWPLLNSSSCVLHRALSGNDTASQLIATALQQQGLLPQQLSSLGGAFNQALQEQAWQVITVRCATAGRNLSAVGRGLAVCRCSVVSYIVLAFWFSEILLRQ